MMNYQVASPILDPTDTDDEPLAWRPLGAVAARFALQTAALRARPEERDARAPAPGLAWAAE